MGKVIKVIDLLNMLAEFQNSAKVKLPRKIKINDIIYNFNDSAKMYFSEMIQEGNGECNYILDYHGGCLYGLNDEVEILDEEQEIDNVNAYKLMEAPYMAECLRNDNFDKFMELLKQSELEVVEKLNNVIGKINQLDNKIKEK